ncbi:uncharacterized protein LOC141857137 [Brevipalpus obovatus]|uniref:uncharacterized protein LOC141857137 n=1 Tax=Brevipalpus obovatus TaxID=246614 RepID=UPI003D9E2B2F
MSKLTILAIIFTTYFCLLSLPQAHADYESDFFGPKLVIRAPRSITNIFRRFFGGRRKQTGFQGTAQAQQPYDVAAASYYPSYMPGSYHGLPYSSGYGSFGGYHPMTSSFASYPGLDYGSMASAASLYPGFSPYSSSLSGSSGFDYQSYLDSLSGSSSVGGGRGGVGGGVGSSSSPTSSSSVASSSSSASGVSSSGSSSSDQDTSASSLSVKGDYPSSISLKSLYSSFPYAFTPEASALDWHVPFARKHGLRRMSADKSNVAYQLQKLMSQSNQQQSLKQKERHYKEQDQIRNMLMNPQEYIAQIIQQELASQQAQLQSGVSARSTPDNQPAASSVSASVSSSSSPNYQSQSNYYYTSAQASGKPRSNLSASASSTSQSVSRKGSGLTSNQVSSYDRSSSSESTGSGKSSLRARSYSDSS